MKKIFLLLAFMLLIPLTAMAENSSNLKDSKWIIEKATQDNLWEMDFDTVNQETPLTKIPGNDSTYMAATSHVKDFMEFYDFGKNDKLRGIILFTQSESSHKKMEKELARSLGTPMLDQSDRIGWLKGTNIIVSFFDANTQMYAIGIMDMAFIANQPN